MRESRRKERKGANFYNGQESNKKSRICNNECLYWWCHIIQNALSVFSAVAPTKVQLKTSLLPVNRIINQRTMNNKNMRTKV